MHTHKEMKQSANEKGAALVLALLSLALMLTLVMGISLTAISELGVTNTYANQTQAFQAAEAGLYHAVNLTRNFTNGADGNPDFTKLLYLRGVAAGGAPQSGTISTDYLAGNNPFNDPARFATGCTMVADNQQLYDANGNAVAGATYSVHMVDDEKSSSAFLPKIPNFNPTGTWEDANATKDTNNRVVVYSTGRYGSASVTLEGWIGFVPYPALVAQDDVTVSGNAQIQGAYGGVHSNGDLVVSGSSDIEQTATAVGTGTFSTSGTIGGFHAGGQEALYIPKFVTAPTATSSPHIADYIVQTADVILIDPDFANGATSDLSGSDAVTARVKKLADSLSIPSSLYSDFAAKIDTNDSSVGVQQTTAVALKIDRSTNPLTITGDTTNLSTYGWNYSGGNWNIPSNSTGASGHTFYVVGVDNYDTSAVPGAQGLAIPKNGGNVDIQGNAGSLASPIYASILATGSITISGNPYLEANTKALATTELPPFVTINPLLIAVEDVRIDGDVGAGTGIIRFSGICYAGEQVYLSGNGEIQGQVLALNNPNVHGTNGSNSSPVDSNGNEVTGSFVLNFNGGQAVGKIKLMSWRQIKLNQ